MNKEIEAGCGAVGAPVEPTVMQHTQGPWECRPRDWQQGTHAIYSHDGRMIAQFSSAAHLGGRDGCIANAKLAATAPELAEVVRQFLEVDPSFMRGSVDDVAALASAGNRLAPLVLKARLVLLKSRGAA